MKRCFIIYFCLFLFVGAFAQVQVGHVKTIGRPNRPGKPLEGVTLRFRGLMNAFISKKDGKFLINFNEKKEGDVCFLMSVSKKGYELADKECLSRGYVISSSVPIQIVLVSTEELEKERHRIENNAYKVAEENYKKKKAEIEKQLADLEIAKEKSMQQLEQLEKSYQNYISLISDMADRYARTDYDQLDSIDVEINKCIEAGELERADSLIHTVFDPETVLERNRQAKQEINERKALALQALKQLTADKEAILRDVEYAKRVATSSILLAREYANTGDSERSKELYLSSIELLKVIYGNDSKEVNDIISEMNCVK